MYWKETDSNDFSYENLHGGKGIIRAHKFFTEQSQTGFGFQVWELAPGNSEGIHIHRGENAYEEIYYFLAGKGIMTVRKEKVLVKKGDAVLVPPGIEHGLLNNGNKPLRLVLLFGKADRMN